MLYNKSSLCRFQWFALSTCVTVCFNLRVKFIKKNNMWLIKPHMQVKEL